MNNQTIPYYCIALLLVFILAGCSGGGESGIPTISGVAAAGAPLSGTVYLKDSSSPAKEVSAPIAADGSFSFNLDGLTAPFLVKAVGTVTGKNLTIYSFAAAPGVANINPLSNLAVAEANGDGDLATFYNTPDPAKMRAIMAVLPDTVTNVQNALRPTLAKFGAADVNFIADPYEANHQGLDLLLDMVDIRVGSGVVTITDKTTDCTILKPLSAFNTSSIDIITNPITTAGSVTMWPRVSYVAPNETVAFSTIVVGASDQQITWSVVEAVGGTITDSGIYTAPPTTGTYHVKATSATNTLKSATATVTVTGVNTLRIAYSGPGVFSVQGGALANVAGIDLTITYDPASYANPQIIPGAMTSGGKVATNTSVPGTARLAFITIKPIAGTLATFSFDVLGSPPGGILSLTARLVDSRGRPLPAVIYGTDLAPDLVTAAGDAQSFQEVNL